MNKLLILALLGFALIALTAGEEEVVENSLQSVQAEVQQLREVREADAKKIKERKNRKNKAVKRKKNGKKGEKKGKKGKKEKKTAKRQGKKTTKGKRNKKGKGKGKNKSGKESKTRNVKKNPRNGGNRNGNNREAHCNSDDTCLEKAVTYLKQLKDKVKNFQAQSIRITKFNKLSLNKGAKKDEFISIMSKLRESVGGNSSAPKCQGETDSPGASSVKTILETLQQCAPNIQNKCETVAPTVNNTQIEDCTNKTDILDQLVNTCLAESDPAKVCVCWKGLDLKKASEDISDCDISQINKNVTDYKKGCTSAFADCRGEQDNANVAIYLCSSSEASPGAILEKLKASTETKGALNELKTAVTAATARKAVARQSRATTCTEFAEKVKAVAALAAADPATPGLAAQIKAIVADPPAPCSDAEKAALLATLADIDAAITSADEFIASAQAELEQLTGSTASTADIANGGATTVSTETTAGSAVPTAAPVRKNIMKLKKLFQNM